LPVNGEGGKKSGELMPFFGQGEKNYERESWRSIFRGGKRVPGKGFHRGGKTRSRASINGDRQEILKRGRRGAKAISAGGAR